MLAFFDGLKAHALYLDINYAVRETKAQKKYDEKSKSNKLG